MSTMSEYSSSSPSQSIGVRQIVIGTLPNMQKRKIDENAQNTSVTRFKPTLVSLPKADFKALLEVPEVKEVLEASRIPPKKGYLIKNNEIEWFIKSDNEIRQLAKFSILDLNTGRIICYWMPSAIDEVSRTHLEAPEPSPIAQKRVSFDGAGPSPKIQKMNPPAETEVITLEDEAPLSYVPISLNNDQLTHWLIKIERILIDQKEMYERKLIDQHEMFEQKLMEQQAMYEQRFEKMEELIQRNHGDVIQIGNDDRSRVNHELASIRSDMVIREKSPQPTMAETLAAMKKAAKRKRK